jgi:hypothetical protein
MRRQSPVEDRRASGRLPQSLPDWLPPVVANYAQKAFTAARKDISLKTLERLTYDDRMEQVWSELQRRKRQADYSRTETFLHPATSRESWSPEARANALRAQKLLQEGGSNNEHEAKKLELIARLNEFAEKSEAGSNTLTSQNLALVFVLQQALKFSQQQLRPVPKIEADQKRKHYLQMARRIRADLALRKPYSSATTRLSDAAFAYEELADQAAPPPGDPLLVTRQRRGDKHQNGFVIALVGTTTAVFGSPLYGVVATMTNVAFGCSHWTDAKVRKMAAHTLPVTETSADH